MTDIAYTPLRITTIKHDRQVDFPIYIYFKEQYLEYVQPGSSLEKEKYKKLRKQKITKFFIKDTDEHKYQQFLDNMLQVTLDDPNASTEEKCDMVKGQSETAVDRLSEDPTNETNFDMTRKAAKNLQKLIFENPSSLNQMFGQDEDSDEIIQHCVNVAVLSIKFAQECKVSDEDIDYLSTAALMHDVGVIQMKKESQDLFYKPKQELAPAEKTSYYDHCKGAVQILAERPYINNHIIELIEAHEENLQGSGPLKKSKLTKPMEILSLVNSYDKKIVTAKVSPSDAIKEMMIDELGNYNLDLLTKFQGFLKSEGVIS